MKDFKQHLQNFKQNLIQNVPFAFARYSDGELFILQNKELKLDDGVVQVGDNITNVRYYQKQDFKHFDPVKHKDFRLKLIEALQYKASNYFKGISCRCCVGDASYKEQIDLHGGDDESLTWANLFVNSNYPTFLKELMPIIGSKKVVMVCNHDADLSQMQKCLVKDFRVGYNAMINDLDKIQDIKNWISENDITDHVFLFSASTFSNLAIYELFKDHNKNTYMDIGTCLAPFMKMPIQRNYLLEYFHNAPKNDLNRVCVW
jgi:hypothetical protein